jgi:transcriptional regulator with XRE-family HTH domain
MTLGEYLKKKRESAGFTQLEIATKLKIGPQFVSNVERDLCNPSVGTIAKWCGVISANKRIVFRYVMKRYESRIKKAMGL